jgi:ATP-dependent RNA helicase DDX3X
MEEEAARKANGGGGNGGGDGDRGGDRWGGGSRDGGDRWGGGGDRGGGSRWGGGRDDRDGGGRWGGGGGDRGGGGGGRDFGDRWGGGGGGGGGGRDFGGDRWGGGSGYDNRGYGGRGGGGGGGRRGNSSREDAEIEKLFESSKNAAGINFDKYDDIPVDVIPPHSELGTTPLEKYGDDLNLHKSIMDNIERAGYVKPTPVQKHALPILNANYDIMACAQTGSGKTAAFLFPMISMILSSGGANPGNGRCSFPKGLILAPTRELVQQIYDEGRKFCYKTGLRCAVAYGGGENIRDQLRAVENGADIIAAAPGRLVDFMERGKVKLPDIMFLCLDEADRMLDMGFEPQIRRIVQQDDMPDNDLRQTLLFSATFPREVQRLAQDFLRRNFVQLTVGRVGAATDTINQKCFYARDSHDKSGLLIDVLESQVCVYARARVRVCVCVCVCARARVRACVRVLVC